MSLLQNHRLALHWNFSVVETQSTILTLIFFTLYIVHQSVNVAGKLYKFVLCLCFLRLIHDDCSTIYSQSLLHKVHLKHKQCFQNPNRFSYLFRTFGSLAHKDIWNTWHYNLLAMNVPDVSKRQRKAKGQSITDNPEKLATLNI